MEKFLQKTLKSNFHNNRKEVLFKLQEKLYEIKMMKVDFHINIIIRNDIFMYSMFVF